VTKPSTRPSFASHSAITACVITGSFSGGMALGGSLSVATSVLNNSAVIKCVQ